MGLLDYVAQPAQRVAYLFPETYSTTDQVGKFRSVESSCGIRDVFVFQFWPQQLTDTYTPNYISKTIPGASHPLYQWTGGNGRDISFNAEFVSEIREDEGASYSEASFRDRIQASSATSMLSGLSRTGPLGAIGALLLPSARYTVNVTAALAALQQYLYPLYPERGGTVKPPRKLVLVLPGTKLGRDQGDGILCILRSANVTMESWFPSGQLRSATISLQFSEIVQHTTGDVSKIKYIGAQSYKELASKYVIPIANPNELTLM